MSPFHIGGTEIFVFIVAGLLVFFAVKYLK